MKTAAIQTVKNAIIEIESQLSCDIEKLDRYKINGQCIEEVSLDVKILNDTMKALKKVQEKYISQLR